MKFNERPQIIIDDYIADLAGIKEGDIIKEIEGREIKDSGHVTFKPDKTSTVVVERNGTKLSFDVEPEEKPYVRIRLKETGKINAYAKFRSYCQVWCLGRRIKRRPDHPALPQYHF